jgi:hypothetical protein
MENPVPVSLLRRSLRVPERRRAAQPNFGRGRTACRQESGDIAHQQPSPILPGRRVAAPEQTPVRLSPRRHIVPADPSVELHRRSNLLRATSRAAVSITERVATPTRNRRIRLVCSAANTATPAFYSSFPVGALLSTVGTYFDNTFQQQSSNQNHRH